MQKFMKNQQKVASLLFEDLAEREMIIELSGYLPQLLQGRKYSDIKPETVKEIFAEIGFDPEDDLTLIEFLRQRKI